MIPIKNTLQLKLKKKQNFRSLSAQSSFVNIQFEKNSQKQQSLEIRKNLLVKNSLILQKNQPHEFQQTKRCSKRLTLISNGRKIPTNAIEKENHLKLPRNKNNQKEENIRISQPFCVMRNPNKRLSLRPKYPFEKQDYNVIQLLNYCENNLNDENKQDQSEHNFTQKSQQSQSIQNKKYHNQKNQDNQTQCLYRKSSFRWLKNSNVNSNGEESMKLSSLKNNLNLSSKVHQISICPWSKENGKNNQQVQTIQSQTEFFQYMVFKRKKQQYQNELMDLFSDISIVTKDKQQILKRKSQIQKIYQQQPNDEREKRIFQLKKDIGRLEDALQSILNQTLKKEQNQINEVHRIQITTLSGLEKIDETIKGYLKIFKQAFQKYSDTKYLRIVERLQNMISNILSQVNKQINYQIKKGKSYQQQSSELKHTINEFINSNNEYKMLLKNCFQHLKKTPQLCYELFGEKSPQIEISLEFKNENNEFQKPKCVHCFNSKWKLHTVVEQNISMKSVLKVTQQLLK